VLVIQYNTAGLAFNSNSNTYKPDLKTLVKQSFPDWTKKLDC